MSNKDKKFESRSGMYSPERIQKYGMELYHLLTRNNGKLIPKGVVESAKPLVSPLHEVFEWDDAVAAREHRLKQARSLIRDVVEVQIITKNGRQEELPINSFHHIKDNVGQFYISVSDACTKKEYSIQILDSLISTLESTTKLMDAFKTHLKNS